MNAAPSAAVLLHRARTLVRCLAWLLIVPASGVVPQALAASPASAAAAAPTDAARRAGPGGLRDSAFAALHGDAEPFQAAWERHAGLTWPHGPITGLALPHHLPAADLIARGLRLARASGMRPDRIVILAPDHFKRAGRPFATALRDHDTAVGRVAIDRRMVSALLQSALVEDSDLIGREHGIGVLLPFVRLAFPDVPVVPIAVSILSRHRHWEAMAALLLRLADDRTLVLQSTDFSHYLPLGEATRRDQRTLNLLAAGAEDGAAALQQPRDVDSAGAQFIQARWQRQRHGTQPIVLENLNSAALGATDDRITTSYMLHVYAGPRAAQRVIAPGPAVAQTLCLAGDTFFGRYLARWLAEPRRHERVLAQWRERLRGCPLVVNLEAVLSDAPEPPPLVRGVPRLRTPVEPTLRALRALNVVAVGVANNHARDLGDAAHAAMVARLQAAGFVVLEHGKPASVMGFRILALRDFDNPPRGGRELIDGSELDGLRQAAATGERSLVFVHWGREFRHRPGERESALAQQWAGAGAQWIVGAHPHRASPSLQALEDGRAVLAYSLGNFAFDQAGPSVSGAVLQISCFAQGSCATRLLPVPDVYTLGR